MSRRLHVPKIHPGFVTVDPAQLHHALQVLRLPDGTVVELFDDTGRTASGRLRGDGVDIEVISESTIISRKLTIAAAVPKGERADWMVEKLSELGVDEFVPLAAERSVVLPEGQGKRSRWERIAVESAKQSRRSGVMRIGRLTAPLVGALAGALGDIGRAWYLSTGSNTVPIGELLGNDLPERLLMYIGPEGGWTERECAAFEAAGVTAVKLTDTILRIETAAITAAAVVLAGSPSFVRRVDARE